MDQDLVCQMEQENATQPDAKADSAQSNSISIPWITIPNGSGAIKNKHFVKSYFLLLISFLSFSLCSSPVNAQSTIIKSVIHSRNSNYSKHTIDIFKVLRTDDYDQAGNQQLGVFGSDFYGRQQLDSRFKDESYWYPITGYKETMCVPMLSY